MSLIGAAAVSAGSSLLGGLMNKKSASKSVAQQNQMAQAQFDAQMDQTIQRRVADAKQAGIHPLYALGASSGASPTISGQAETGSHMGDAIASAGGALASGLSGRAAEKQRQIEVQQRMALEAQRTHSEVNRNNAAAYRDRMDPIINMYRANLVKKAAAGAASNQDGRASREAEMRQEMAMRTRLEREPQASPLKLFGANFTPSRTMSTGQAIEDALGEGAALLLAPALLGGAIGETIYNAIKPSRGTTMPAEESDWLSP